MDFRHKIIALTLGLFFFLVIVYFIRKRSIHPSSVLLWLLVSCFLLSIPLFESLYKSISGNIVGFEDSRHVIYIVIIGFLLVHSFYLTVLVSKLSDYVKILIKDLALLEEQINSKNKHNE